jgi:uncharacterized protein DUF6599
LNNRGTSSNLLVSDKIDLMQLRFTISAFISAVLLLAPSSRAADVQWPAKIGRWTNAPTASDARMPGLDELAPTGLLKESGLKSASSRTYRDGDRLIRLTIYTFRDSSGAYEAYPFLCPGESPVKVGDVGIVRSNLVLYVRSDSDLSAEDRQAFEAWERSVSDGVASPPVATYLPDQGKERLTEQYALGPVAFREAANSLGRADAAELVNRVGFNSGAEAMFARYKSGASQAVLLLIDYPTPQLAVYHQKHLELGLSEIAGLGQTRIEQKGSLLVIVLAPSSATYAESLRKAVNYETQVTWNEPSQTLTDPPWTSVIAQIFIGTGVFMVAAVVLGIAFGGVRVVTKIFFPGKVFDRPERMEILQLGLSGKKIDPSDFY